MAVGGGDRTVTIWDVEKGNVLYKLPGHRVSRRLSFYFLSPLTSKVEGRRSKGRKLVSSS